MNFVNSLVNGFGIGLGLIGAAALVNVLFHVKFF